MGQFVPSSNPPGDHGSLVVLVVDDDAATRTLAFRWLEAEGLTLETAADGRSALEFAEANAGRLGAIVLDVMMPGLDGYAVLERLKKNPVTAPIPVLLLTAHANADADVVRGIAAGAVDHLQKPFRGAILAARVHALCAERRSALALQAQLARAREAAATDALTGFGNRRAFDEQIEIEARLAGERGQALAVLMIDLDRFKSVNDDHGHTEGDRVLVFVADTLRAVLGEPRMAFRFGGEEFVVLLRQTERDGALLVARTLKEALSRQAFEFAGGERRTITFSGGVSAADAANGYRTDELIDRADQALYRAKGAGRNRTELEALASAEAPRWSLIPT